MATEARGELRSDVHSIEPIPEADKDSTGPQQMWIWAGANIAPINWALGALGIVLKLGLWETIAARRAGWRRTTIRTTITAIVWMALSSTGTSLAGWTLP